MNSVVHVKSTCLKDYVPSDYLVSTLDLTLNLGEELTVVTARMRIYQNILTKNPSQSLKLDGEGLKLISIAMNGKKISPSEYVLNEQQLILLNVPSEFMLEIITHISPIQNTALSGLYVSRGIFCTQCEAQGFRRISYYLDRPDVLASYSTTLTADKNRYPTLLSNGNLIERGDLDNGQHFVKWEDPFKKPSYLFAVVAGQLDKLEDTFITCSGKKVLLQIYAEKGQRANCSHAMESVKKAMRWDEEAYGREYDLSIFMLAAIDDFNMGAMENKGLNIFNTKCIIANPQTSTDTDYLSIQLVVGHEYFHNWSGDRVTCRDWFQLSLKEGLTVFREQEFTADMSSAIVARIQQVKRLRTVQFIEDSGPLAHPVQPECYIEINNFYTPTIYEKGAEVIRMLKILLGPQKFRQAMDFYFNTYDGQAITIEEFIHAMEVTSAINLKQFRLWYKQAGTPILEIKHYFDDSKKTYTLTIKQTCPPTPLQTEKKPFHLPFVMGLIDKQGVSIPLKFMGDEKSPLQRTLEIRKEVENFQFIEIEAEPVPSILRGFSAPVKLKITLSDETLLFLLKYDSDGFNRWDAAQELATRLLLDHISGKNRKKFELITTAFYEILAQDDKDKLFIAELLTLPSETYIASFMDIIEPDKIYQTRQALRRQIAENLSSLFLNFYKKSVVKTSYHYNHETAGTRRLKNLSLSYLMLLNRSDISDLCRIQYEEANNMTDRIAALGEIVNNNLPEKEKILEHFYENWKHDSLVMDKWLAIQAYSPKPDSLERIKHLRRHPAFNLQNPNKVRALIGSFAQENLVTFHQISGEGYKFLGNQIIELNDINPQGAARLAEYLTRWQRYNATRQQLMRTELKRIKDIPHLSRDVYEIVSKGLN